MRLGVAVETAMPPLCKVEVGTPDGVQARRVEKAVRNKLSTRRDSSRLDNRNIVRAYQASLQFAKLEMGFPDL